MSGGGGSGDGGFAVPGGDEPCQDLVLWRNLEGPVPGVADALVVGDVLSVELRDGPPQVVVAITAAGAEAGGILPTRQLLECMQSGAGYEATVTEARGGMVRVEVRAAP